ncbi:MAG: hypothetical protein [Bacteriophage sp.]|nr:MAG: hypothetical protein [Bacteriophage sp.]
MVATTTIKDTSWIEYSFMLAGEKLLANAALTRYRNLSTADFKYTGSGFGQNTVINAAPQFTPLADIRRTGITATTNQPSTGKRSMTDLMRGMGRAYSEMIDDNKQVVHIRFGVTQYKGLISFFTGFYDANSASLARTGRMSIFYYFGLVAGTVGTLFLQPFILAGKAINFILGRSSSRYMDLKPTMPLYWERVQVIMNNIGAQMGIIPRLYATTGAFGQNADTIADLDNNNNVNANYKTYMNKLMPKVFTSDGQFNILEAVGQPSRNQQAYAARVQNLSGGSGGTNKQTFENIITTLAAPLTQTSGIGMADYLKQYHGTAIGDYSKKELDGDSASDKLEEAVNSGDGTALKTMLNNSIQASSNDTSGSTTDAASADATNSTTNASNQLDGALSGAAPNTSATNTSQSDPDTTTTTTPVPSPELSRREMRTVIKPIAGASLTSDQAAQQQKEITEGTSTNILSSIYHEVTGWLSDVKDFMGVEWNNGTAFLNLAVNYTGPGTLSISNGTKETSISTTLNGISQTSRDSRIAMSDFQTGFGFLDGAIKAVGDVFSGALDAVSMSGLMALAGNAFIDFPKQWDNSTTQVPTANFTIQLRNPYGNAISRYINLYTVVACLLAGACPLSTGTQSYTSPFVCEAYSRGVCAIRYGMITSLSITHGAGNLGFNKDRQPLGFDISFEVADLSSVMHAPISNGMSPVNIFKRVFDDDNIFNDYLSTITGLSLDDMVNPKRKLAIRLATQMKNVQSWWAPEHIASRLVGTSPIQTLNKVFGPSYFPGT